MRHFHDALDDPRWEHPVFMECDSCHKKKQDSQGKAYLCMGCIHNEKAILLLREALSTATDGNPADVLRRHGYNSRHGLAEEADGVE
jgi:hypothetical protein